MVINAFEVSSLIRFLILVTNYPITEIARSGSMLACRFEEPMEPVLALNYLVPMFDELLGFFGSGSEPGSIPNSNHPYEF